MTQDYYGSSWKAFFQVFRFPDIDNRSCGIIHTIDAGLAGHGFQERFGIKLICHWLANVSALHRPWRIAVSQLYIAMNV